MNSKSTQIHNTTAVATQSGVRSWPVLWRLPRLMDLDWSYPTFEKRDLRLDLLRGFAVVVMVVDHFGGSSWLYLVTGGNSFFVSGAEAFIFISGLVVGMVYGGIAIKQGIRSAQIKALSRAWILYKLNVVLTLLFAIASVALGLDWAKGLSLSNPLAFIFDVATLHQTLYLVDIPLMYTLLMAAAAGALWLLFKNHTALLLTLSTLIWILFQLFPSQMQVPWHIDGTTVFNVAAWQLLFFWAMAIGYHRESLTQKLATMPRLPYLFFSGLLFIWLVRLYDTQGAWLSRLVPGLDVQAFMAEFFSKSALAPGRLIASFIVFQFAYLAVTLFWKPVWAALGWMLLPLGQNALYAYTVHVAIIGAVYAVLPHLPVDIAAMGTLNTSLQLLAVLAIWAMIQRQFLFRVIPR